MSLKNTVIDMFSEQVIKSPEGIAIVFEDLKLTYSEVDKKSNQLANHLLSIGVNPGNLIPICINRSVEMLIGILAILKTGSAYVPIDPNYPLDRIKYIFDDCGATFILSNTKSQKENIGQPVLIDTFFNNYPSLSSDSPQVSFSETDLAYIIYTSGTTGKPKGVMIENRSIASYISNQTKYFGINVEDRIIQFSNYCFDASVEQIFLALTNGASLFLINDKILRDVEIFTKFLIENSITHLHATPGFIENIPSEKPTSLKRIVSAGDICKKELFKKWIGKLDFYNKYGPTEATISVLECLCTPSFLTSKSLPIGTPVKGAAIYLKNESLEEVESGEIGEIYVGGIQLSRGYLNQPELTAQNFIKNPLNDTDILYKTGDLARKLDDGNIEFVGRIDDQVKVRGYRIELSEIENVLREAPTVTQCAVIVQADDVFGKRLVAYVVINENFNRDGIFAYLSNKLPEYMIPQFIVKLDQMPLNNNGKVDKNALPHPDAASLLTNEYAHPKTATEKKLVEIWQNLLNVSRVGIADNFFELGGNSLLAQKFVLLLKEFGFALPIVKLYQFPNVEAISAFLDGVSVKPKLRVALKSEKLKNDEVAIIGMAARLPGADTIDEFWDNLINGKETIRYFSDQDLDASIPAEIKNDGKYVKARGIINNPKEFDPAFFGINPKLAALMDPQQRIFLQIAWEALESSNHVPEKYSGSIGVYAGCRFNTYYTHNVISNKELIENVGAFQVGTVSDKDYIASRTAYSLNLNGPAVNVQSACSTSLLAVAQAVQSIRNGQCDVAVAGGSSMLVPINSGHLYEEGAMFSKDGHSRTFDANAAGTVFSDGAGVVILKSKRQAELDGDLIYGVIKGIGLSNDGGNKGSFTAPSAEGQANAIFMAINDAGVNAADISYIEAHGTATPLGDPIEIEGLKLAFGDQAEKQYCAIGSVKSNIGHLTAASGVTGLIKTALALYHKTLPASINFEKPNPHINFEDSPFYVNKSLKNWDSDKKRIAGVSSFGVGGTNVHVILEEHTNFETQRFPSAKSVQIITLSAKNDSSLKGYSEKLRNYLVKDQEVDLVDIAYTLNTERNNYSYRTFVYGEDKESIIKQLNSIQGKKAASNINEIAFMFPGQGSQFINMGKSLYLCEPVFKDAVDECVNHFQTITGEDILKIIYPEEVNDEAENKLKDTKYSQPSLFILGYALSKLWMSWGIYPSIFIGHSIGEFVAAYFSGVFSLHDAIKIISSRGKLMSELPSGSMLSVRGNYSEIEKTLPANISTAAINSPDLFVLAGKTEDIESLADLLTEKNIVNKILQTSHAFHSYMMDSVIEPFKQVLQEIKLNAPLIPIYSTVTGKKLSDDEAININYWANHLRATVRFETAANTLLTENPDVALLEMGPGNAATTFFRQNALGKHKTIINSLDFPKLNENAHHSILRALGQLWASGYDVNWKLYYGKENRSKLYNLPTYAFNNSTYWVEPKHNTQSLNIDELDAQNGAATTYKPLPIMRKQALITQLKAILENASGIEMHDATPEMTFIEIGLDSLLLTQVALTLKKEFSLPVTFRQLNEEYGTLNLLADYLDANLPADAISISDQQPAQPLLQQQFQNSGISFPPVNSNGNGTAIDLISQQLQLLAMQLSLIQGNQPQLIQQNSVLKNHIVGETSKTNSREKSTISPDLTPEEEIEIKKPFGAAARIEKQSAALNEVQTRFLSDLTIRYNEKTKGSKAYTQKHRAQMADPRVVSGFKPATKELVYSIVINKSKGSRVWDIDGNEYIDALNGFGSNMLGYQPDFIKNALIEQIEKGYEIGPQHELAGEVSSLICDFTKFDRAGLCNTGSEAVLGAMRIARTVTGRSIIVAFTGSYHGIMDEVIVRGSKKLKTFPAAPGILPEAVQNMLILDYGTEESLKIIEERADEIAAVLVEPIQSRRADFQPIEFLKKLRKITETTETVLIFDEVISGFRFHPQGVQGLFGIQADIGTYGKVAGGGISIGIIAGKKKYMDALDGGFWQYGDDSIPEVGVTYFAGTFVRHPLALATAKASLNYLKEMGPQLQENLNANGSYVANSINKICKRLRVPLYVAQFGSLWRIKFIEEYPYTELFFTLMRLKGIHVLEGFACFLTTAHTNADIQQIIKCFEESLIELKEVGFIPDYEHSDADIEINSINLPPVPNAKLGKDREGNPAWFIKDDENPGKYLQVN